MRALWAISVTIDNGWRREDLLIFSSVNSVYAFFWTDSACPPSSGQGSRTRRQSVVDFRASQKYINHFQDNFVKAGTVF
jgi:hypothetical protein